VYIKGAKIPGPGDIKTKYSNDTLHTFYIKPRMRIKRELINPPDNQVRFLARETGFFFISKANHSD